MKQREEILNQFIVDTLSNEDSKNLQIVTKQDISNLVKKFEDSGISHLSIDPDVEYIKDPVDLFIVLDDIDLSQRQIGTIKILLSQKIIIFSKSAKNRSEPVQKSKSLFFMFCSFFTKIDIKCPRAIFCNFPIFSNFFR